MMYALSSVSLAREYLTAKRDVVDAGYAYEIQWQVRVKDVELTAQRFAEEAAWVVLSTGMSAAVVKRLFPSIRRAFRSFDTQDVVHYEPEVRADALRTFRNKSKVDGIIEIVKVANRLGSGALRHELNSAPRQFLLGLPWIGPVTWLHLAKNLGVPVAKPDRHLSRIAACVGRPSVQDLCEDIGMWLGEPVAVVDVVLWRWATLHSKVCLQGCSSQLHPPRVL